MEQKELNAISDLFKSEYDKLLKEINDKLTFAYENADKLLEENNRLKTELAELKQNAIVPKFNCRDKVYFIEDEEYYRIEVGKVMHNNKYVISKDIFPYIDYRNESELFATKSEAEEALKEMEE